VGAWGEGRENLQHHWQQQYGKSGLRGSAMSMFYCGGDADAKKTAARLASDVGFEPIDAGPLANAPLLEPCAMLWVWLAVKGGMGR
jgi:hypothetical protein